MRAARSPQSVSQRGCIPRPDSGVFEWQIVTVALAFSRKSAIGFPTISLRPTTDRALPGNLNVGTLEKLHDTGRRAGARGRPVRNKTADIEGMESIGIF